MTNLIDSYFAIKDTDGELICGFDSKTNGMYSTRSKAQAYINRQIKSQFKHIRDQAESWKVIRVKIVEIQDV